MEFSFHRPAAPGAGRKILLIMRLTAILLLTGCLHVAASGHSQTVSLSVSGAPLEKVCEDIEAQTGYYFVYTKHKNDKSYAVSVHLNNVPLSEALRKVFDGLPFTYQLFDKVVVVTSTGQDQPDNTATDILKDTLEVKGRVINLQAEPLVNASVTSLKTKKSVQTNAKGQYSIMGLAPDDELIISYVGYKTQKIKIAGRSDISAVLEVSNDELDKAVVQAYGTTSQRFTTGNIGVVTAEDIRKQPVTNPLLALEGRVAGLVITPQTGYESGPIKVEIRGRNGVNPLFTSDPLYIIDGVPLTILDVGGVHMSAYSSNAISAGIDQTHISFIGGQSPLASINPADIESIEVLKDADATAIYGSRGAAGVILITTKKGKAGKSRFDLDVSQGLSYITRYWDMLNTPQYLQMRREAFKNDGITPSAAAGTGFAPDLYIWDTTRYTNWQKYLFGNAGKWTNVQGAYSGGTAQTTYRLAAGYGRTTDISTFHGANQKASLAVNLNTTNVNQRFKTAFTANFTYTDYNMNNITGVATLAPNAPAIYDSTGNFNYAQWDASSTNFPFTSMGWTYESKTNFLTSNLSLSYNILKGLIARASFGYNLSMNSQVQLQPISSQDPHAATKPTGRALFGTNQLHNWIIEPQLEYTSFIGRGALDVLGGATVQANSTVAQTVTGGGYTDDVLLRSISNALTITAINNSGMYKYAGIFARINYRLDNKYILNLNGRRDGSSRFGPGKQFGDFGSVGAAWIMSEEGWMKKVLPKAISFVKLRGSYGITGSDAVGDYQYLSQWGNNSSPQISSYDGYSALVALIEDNPNFHWQVNKKLEGALDLSFLEDHINLEAAYYRNRCNNQLIGFPTPSFTGFSSVTANSPANVQNLGWEFQLSARIIEKKNFSWSTNFDLSLNRNKLLGYPHIDQSPYYNTLKIGQSLDNIYLLKYTGINPANGHYSYYDRNHDDTIIVNDNIPRGTGNDDRFVPVNLNPKFSGGWGHQFTYKRVMLSAFFTFRKQTGNNALGYTAGTLGNTSVWQFQHRWQSPGQEALAPRLTTKPGYSDGLFSSSTGNWSDASFIRLQTLNLSYTVSDKWARKAGMSRMAFMLSAQNIFIITSYKGIDPEVPTFGGMPPARTITAGLSCSF